MRSWRGEKALGKSPVDVFTYKKISQGILQYRRVSQRSIAATKGFAGDVAAFSALGSRSLRPFSVFLNHD